jgi:hypothetical protein
MTEEKQKVGIVQPATLESEQNPRNPNRRVLFPVPASLKPITPKEKD